MTGNVFAVVESADGECLGSLRWGVARLDYVRIVYIEEHRYTLCADCRDIAREVPDSGVDEDPSKWLTKHNIPTSVNKGGLGCLET